MNEIKDFVVQLVADLQGCKATELAVELVSRLHAQGKSFEGDLPELLQALIQEGRILEVEYIVPTSNHKIKSFLLPAHTKIKFGELDAFPNE